jgi:hypothetical protein
MDRADYRYNSEYRATVRAQMIALAKGLVADDLGLIPVARKLSTFCDGVELEIGALLNVFVAVHSETDALPIGEERTLWNAETLVREDKKLARPRSVGTTEPLPQRPSSFGCLSICHSPPYPRSPSLQRRGSQFAPYL